MSRYASRKFLLTAAVVLFAAVAFWLSKMTEGAFIDLVKWALGLYFTGNVGAKAADKLGLTVKAAP